MRWLALAIAALTAAVAAAAAVSIYTWGWRSDSPSERAEALGAARELTRAVGNIKGYSHAGVEGVEQLGPGRWMARVHWNGKSRCIVFELARFRLSGFADNGNPKFDGWLPASCGG